MKESKDYIIRNKCFETPNMQYGSMPPSLICDSLMMPLHDAVLNDIFETNRILENVIISAINNCGYSIDDPNICAWYGKNNTVEVTFAGRPIFEVIPRPITDSFFVNYYKEDTDGNDGNDTNNL